MNTPEKVVPSQSQENNDKDEIENKDTAGEIKPHMSS